MLQTAGFALVHGLGSIGMGGTLCTLAVIHRGNREVTLRRYEADTIAESIDLAYGNLAEEIEPGEWAALVFDGFVTTETDGRIDALIAEILLPGAQVVGRVSQRYRPAARLGLPGIGRRLRPIGDVFLGPGVPPEAAEAVANGMREHPSGTGILGRRE